MSGLERERKGRGLVTHEGTYQDGERDDDADEDDGGSEQKRPARGSREGHRLSVEIPKG